jgi:hypothetical protein
MLLAALVPVANALAESGGAAAQAPTVPGVGGLGLLIAYLTRRQKIGGWLLYYYMQLYLSLLVLLAGTFVSLEYFNPGRWARTDLYIWYLLSTVPPISSQLFETAAGTYLLARPTEQNVRRLQYAIGALLATTVVALLIDVKFFDDASSLALDTLTIVFSTIWLAYFRVSVRVRRVFVERNWVYLEEVPTSKTLGERRYLRNRSLVWAGGMYVAGLILIAVSEAEKKPDPPMLFGVPLVYAGLAALISYACPISKKKRASLLAADAGR